MVCLTCKLRIENSENEVAELSCRYENGWAILKNYKSNISSVKEDLNLAIDNFQEDYWKLDVIQRIEDVIKEKQQRILDLLQYMRETSERVRSLDCLRQEARDRLVWARDVAKSCSHTESTIQKVHYDSS